MILQALKQYGDWIKPPAQEGIVPDAFENEVKNIQWRLVIDHHGNFVDLRSRAVARVDAKGKKVVTFPALNRVPSNVDVVSDRSHGGSPQFLADNLEYWFGISGKGQGTKSRDSHAKAASDFAAEFPDDARAQAVKKFFDNLASGEVLAQKRSRAVDRIQKFFAARPSNELLANRQQRVIKQVESYFENKQAGTIRVAWNSDPSRGVEKLTINGRPFAVKKPKERLALCFEADDPTPVFHVCENLLLFWSDQYKTANAKRQKAPAGGLNPPCLCCGDAKPAVDVFGQFTGLADQATSLVFTGKPAYQSYQFEKGENAPVCLECSEAIIRGLKELLTSRSTSKRFQVNRPRPGEEEKIPPVVFVFWSRTPTPFDFGNAVNADPETVKRMLDSLHKGIPRELAESDFYILGMSESYRRTMVRYWSETNVKDVVENIAAWFEDLRYRFIEYGPDHNPLSLMWLCKMTVRQPSQPSDEWKFPPMVSTGLFLSAFLRKPVPPPVLQLLVNRVRTISQTDYDDDVAKAARAAGRLAPDYKLKPARMALLRLTLNRLMKNENERFDVGLDVSRKEPEYHCGRLLAVCDNAMQWANSPQPGKPGISTVADRYMGSASTAPCSVLPVVYRNSRHHLNKLKRDMPVKWKQLEKLLDEILSKLTAYPVTLSAQKAGTFILGFHHQRQYFFLVSRYNKLRKQEKENTLAPEDKRELEALDDFVRRSHFDVSLLANLPDEDEAPIPATDTE